MIALVIDNILLKKKLYINKKGTLVNRKKIVIKINPFNPIKPIKILLQKPIVNPSKKR